VVQNSSFVFFLLFWIDDQFFNSFMFIKLRETVLNV